jgi:hypothetical protein
MAGLVPAIPKIRHGAILIEIAGTSPAMTPRVLLLLRNCVENVAGQVRIFWSANACRLRFMSAFR